MKKVSCNTLSIAAVQPRRLVVQSTKSPPGAVPPRKDENLPERQVRELRAFFPKTTSRERRLSLFQSSSVSVGTAAAKTKCMRAPRPQTPRQVDSPAPRQTSLPSLKTSTGKLCFRTQGNRSGGIGRISEFEGLKISRGPWSFRPFPEGQCRFRSPPP